MQQRQPPGTPLRDPDIREGRVLTTRWHPNARYTWDAGVAIGKYLEGLKRGKLMGTRCDLCRRTVIPPRVFCEWCFRPMSEWVQLSDMGVINTYSVCYVDWAANRVDKPQVPAVIEIEGASKGMGILHLLGEVGEDQGLEAILKNVKMGMRVQALWKPPRKRTGAITDIRYFRPIS